MHLIARRPTRDTVNTTFKSGIDGYIGEADMKEKRIDGFLYGLVNSWLSTSGEYGKTHYASAAKD